MSDVPRLLEEHNKNATILFSGSLKLCVKNFGVIENGSLTFMG